MKAFRLPSVLSCMICLSVSASAQLHTWTELGTGLHAYNGYPYIEVIYCDAANNIYAGGDFRDSSGYNYVAKWNGQSWSQLGTGTHALRANSYIQAITSDPAGNIYASGNFTDSTGTQYVAQWNGTDWSELGTINNPAKFEINALLTDPAGHIYAAGALADDSFHVCVMRWDGSSWSPVGTGTHALGVNSNINTMCWDPSGNLYAAGAFTDSGTLAGHAYVAKWDGTNWSALGTGSHALLPNSYFYTICSDPAGNIYAAGSFTDSGDPVMANKDGARYVAKWDGANWTRLGGTTDTFICAPTSLDNIHTIMSDPSGNIYAAGGMRDTTDFTAHNRTYVARWDGAHWSEIGAVSNHQVDHGYIFSLCMDGWGDLYAAGNYIDSGSAYVQVAVYAAHALGIVGVEQQHYDLSPNPNHGIVTLRLSEQQDAIVHLSDMSGQILQTWDCPHMLSQQLDISAYAAGIYLLSVQTPDGRASVLKVIRE